MALPKTTTRCDIVSPIWNQLERTKRCVESLIKHTHFPYRLVLVDNGSEEPTRKYLESLRSDSRIEVKLIRNDENLGNIKAVNQGVRASDAGYICILDNDTILTEGWLEEMIGAFKWDNSVGIVNPSSNSSGWSPAKGQSIDDYAKYLRDRWGGCYSEMATAVGYCYLITRKLIDAIGVWDETFGMGYYEDRDYSQRALRAGFNIAYAKGGYVYHEEHSSFRVRPEWLALQEKNRAIYESRYGRPKRWLYILSEPNENLCHEVVGNAYARARKNDFVWIFLSEKCLPFDIVDHSNIDVFVFNPFLWTFKMLWKLLKRKKKFHEIYFDRPSDGFWLAFFKWLHKSSLRRLPIPKNPGRNRAETVKEFKLNEASAEFGCELREGQ